MPRTALPLACSLLLVAVATAAPVPKLKPIPISPANADRVKVVAELETDVWRLVPGPAAGELTFVRWDKPVEVVDATTLKPLRTAVEGKAIHFAATAKGDQIAWGDKGSKVWVKPTDGKKVVEIETNQPQADVVFSADGKTLATGGYGKEAHVWGTDGKLLHALDCGGEGGLNPVFSPDGKVLAVGNRNHATNLFDPATGRRLHTLPAKMTHGLAFSPDGKRLAVGYVDGSVAIWGVEKGERLLSAKSTCQEVYSVAWSATGGVLATGGSHGKIELWDAEKLERVRELDGGDWVISARFSEAGTRLYTAGGESANPTNRKVTAWGLGDGK